MQYCEETSFKREKGGENRERREEEREGREERRDEMREEMKGERGENKDDAILWKRGKTDKG